MNNRSLWHFAFILSAFLILNTFILDKSTKPKNEKKSIENIEIEHLPISDLKNTIGDTICSTIALGDVFVTLSSNNLPKMLVNGSNTVHLIKKTNNKLFVYSDKISPKINTHPPLKKGEKFLVLSELNQGNPKLFPATYDNDQIEFIFDTPNKDGIALVETEEGITFAGLWDQSSKTIIDSNKIKDLEDFISARGFSTSSSEEKYYCLENDSIQVVFSNKGAAISELNLKLKSDKNPSSPILKVAVDKKISKESPQNNLYPLHKTYTVDDSGNSVIKTKKQGGYTPLLRRDIVDKDGNIAFKVPANHYGLALSTKNKKYTPNYRVTKFTKNYIQFKGQLNGKEITRTYSLVKNAPYSIEMKNSINGNIPSLTINSGIPEVEIDSGSSTPALLYYNYNGKKMKLEAFKLPKTSISKNEISPSWTANTNGFFATILHPEEETQKGVIVSKIEGKNCPSRVTLIDVDKGLNPKEKFPGYEIKTSYKASLSPSSYYFFAGPLDKNVLSQVDNALTDDVTGFNPEFVQVIKVRGWLTFISDPFARFMNIILDFFHMITNSWGISIILLTITLRLILYPFTAKSFKSMAKMKKIAPKQKEIEAKYKNDPQRQRMELAMLFKNEGVNPLASILPMFLQLPFFIGMFDLLKTKFALRGAVFIPGWINNLTAPDVVFSWGINLPFLGNEFHLLPVLGALSMHFAQKFTSSMQPQKKKPTDMEKQMQSMGPIFTIVFFFIFYNLASGLNIYLIISSLLGVLQQWYINKKFGEKNPNVTVVNS